MYKTINEQLVFYGSDMLSISFMKRYFSYHTARIRFVKFKSDEPYKIEAQQKCSF